MIDRTRQLTTATWRKSTYSAGGNECVEVAVLDATTTAVRDSKNTSRSPVISSRRAFAELIAHVTS